MSNNDILMNRFKTIKENPIILDFTQCKYLDEIHLILKDKFGFPEYYGKNWSALKDCLDGLFVDQGNFVVKIYGYNSLPKELKEYCRTMLEIFEYVQRATPNISFEIIS